MVDVMFVRTPITAASEITTILRNLYLAGWRVVSHDENQGEYTFVLEGTVPARGYVTPLTPTVGRSLT